MPVLDARKQTANVSGCCLIAREETEAVAERGLGFKIQNKAPNEGKSIPRLACFKRKPSMSLYHMKIEMIVVTERVEKEKERSSMWRSQLIRNVQYTDSEEICKGRVRSRKSDAMQMITDSDVVGEFSEWHVCGAQ